MGSSIAFNVAGARSGEGWFTRYVCPERYLKATVEAELAFDDSPLARKMFGLWRGKYGVNVGPSAKPSQIDKLVSAVNNRQSPQQIAKLFRSINGNVEVSFTYTKVKGQISVRQVIVKGVSGRSIRARDLSDNKFKNFRLDRMSNVRPV